MTGLLNPKSSLMVLRYTSFWRKRFLNDGAPQPKIVVNGIKVYLFLAKKFFWITGAPYPKIVGKKRHFSCMILLVVYLGHGILHPVAAAYFSPILLFREKCLKLPNWGVVLETKWCTSIVACVIPCPKKLILTKLTVPPGEKSHGRVILR